MRNPLQPMVLAAIGGCLLAVGTGWSPPRPSATPTRAAIERQVSVSATPTPTALTPVQRGRAFSTDSGPALPTPTRTRPTLGPKLSPEPDAKPPRRASQGGRGKLPVAEDIQDDRPPRRPLSLAAADSVPGATVSPATPLVYEIEAGDTVYLLAGQYGTSPEAILQANGLDEQGARYLDIGQELIIPSGPAAGSAPAQPLQVVHQVQAGEALITIARDYGTTVESIVAANGLKGELILAGQELTVPLPPGQSGASPAQAPAPVTPAVAISGTELLAQTDAPPAAPSSPVTETISPTLPLTQTAGAPPITTTQTISATEPLTQTAAVTQTAPTEPVTGTTESEGAPAPTPDPAASEPPPDAAPAEADPAAVLAALQAAMVGAVNAEREAHGLAAYRVDETITAVARGHAQDMAVREYAGHTSPEGKRVRDRLRDAGLDLKRAGENYYVSTRSAEESVAHTLGWFMGDPPHRKNILHGFYTRMGVGVARGPQGWYIFVLDFAGD